MEKWESIGSPSYRKAIKALRCGWASAIRRTAWGDDRHLYIPNPTIHIFGDYTDGRWPEDVERYPPGRRIIHVTESAQWGKEYWQVPDEDIEADDWQLYIYGQWKDAKDLSA